MNIKICKRRNNNLREAALQVTNLGHLLPFLECKNLKRVTLFSDPQVKSKLAVMFKWKCSWILKEISRSSEFKGHFFTKEKKTLFCLKSGNACSFHIIKYRNRRTR